MSARARIFGARLSQLAVAGLLGLLAGCENRPPATTEAHPKSSSSAPTKEAPDGPVSPEAGQAGAMDASTPLAPMAATVPAAVTEDTARHVLFGSSVPVEASRCEGDPSAKITCWLGARYASDEAAKKLAVDLYTRFGTVVGQGEAETMDGAYRGKIRLVPTLPIGQDRRHLVWVHAALEGIDRFVRGLEARAASGSESAGTGRVTYRAGPLVVKFVRSLDGRTTPSGYAADWQYSYNVVGSLNVSAESVMSLAFHEIFHLNDLSKPRAGARSWSSQALAADVTHILQKCGVREAATAAKSTPCLTPYTPTPLQVRGGTYYAFQPGNDIVLEYAAELATRVFDEQRAALGMAPKRRGPSFKCGPKENARAWKAMVEEYFGGVDLVPGCP